MTEERGWAGSFAQNQKEYVAALDHSGKCASCGNENWIERYPGRFPRCGMCGVIQLWMGKMRDAPCITGNGRTDGHMEYVHVRDGKTSCAFCGRSSEEPLPEWPELDSADLAFEYPVHTLSYVKQDSGVQVTHVPSGTIATSFRFTSRLKNKAAALKELREKLKSVPIGGYECPT